MIERLRLEQRGLFAVSHEVLAAPAYPDAHVVSRRGDTKISYRRLGRRVANRHDIKLPVIGTVDRKRIDLSVIANGRSVPVSVNRDGIETDAPIAKASRFHLDTGKTAEVTFHDHVVRGVVAKWKRHDVPGARKHVNHSGLADQTNMLGTPLAVE